MKKAKFILLPFAALALAGCNGESLIPSFSPNEMPEFNFDEFSNASVDEVLGKLQDSSGYSISFKSEFIPNVDVDYKDVCLADVGAKENYAWAYITHNDEAKVGYAIYTNGEEIKPYYYAAGAWHHAAEYDLTQEEVVVALNAQYNKLHVDEKYVNDVKKDENRIGKRVVAQRDCVVFELNEGSHVQISFDKQIGIAMAIEIVTTNPDTLVTSQESLSVTSFSLSAEVPNFPAE